jgi:hypothetical protein
LLLLLSGKTPNGGTKDALGVKLLHLFWSWLRKSHNVIIVRVMATIVIGPPSGLLVVVVAAVGSVGVSSMRRSINRWWHYSDLDGMSQT